VAVQDLSNPSIKKEELVMKEARSIKDILDLLHIDIIGKEVESVHDMIRESYKVKKYVVEDYREFIDQVSTYYSYHWTTWNNFPIALPYEYAKEYAERKLDMSHDTRIHKVQNILSKGSGGNYLVAAKNCMTGRHGGLPAVIDIIAESIKEDAVHCYVSSVFLHSVNPLDYYKKVAFMQEYLELYGAILIPEEELLSPHELAGNLEAVLQHHVRLVNEFRKTLQ